MGWGRTLLLGDIGNRMDIADVEKEVNRLKRTIHQNSSLDDEQEEQIMFLTAEVAELKLYVKHLVRLLEAKQVVSQQEVEAMVTDVEN